MIRGSNSAWLMYRPHSRDVISVPLLLARRRSSKMDSPSPSPPAIENNQCCLWYMYHFSVISQAWYLAYENITLVQNRSRDNKEKMNKIDICNIIGLPRVPTILERHWKNNSPSALWREQWLFNRACPLSPSRLLDRTNTASKPRK